MTKNLTPNYIHCPTCAQHVLIEARSMGETLNSFAQLNAAYFEPLLAQVKHAVDAHYQMPPKLRDPAIETVLNRIRKYSDCAVINKDDIEKGLVTMIRHNVLKGDRIKDRIALALGKKRLSDALSETDYQGVQRHLNQICGVIVRYWRKL